jgi:hypothetical protein
MSTILWIIVGLGCTSVVVAFGVIVYEFLNKKLAGKSLIASLLAIGLMLVGVGIIGALILAMVNGASSLLSSATFPSLGKGILLVLLSGAALAGVSWLAKQALAKEGSSALGYLILDSVILGIFVFCVLYFLGLQGLNKSAIWGGEIALVAIFGSIGYQLIKWWHPAGLNTFGIQCTYSLLNFFTIILFNCFGFMVTEDVFGSLGYVSFFLMFNALLFWHSSVYNPPKEARKRVSYYIMYGWTVALLVVLGTIVVLQMSHKVTRQELDSSKLTNEYRRKAENWDRSALRKAQDFWKQKADDAFAVGDKVAYEEALAKMEECDLKQRVKVERRAMLFPEGVQAFIALISVRFADPYAKINGVGQGFTGNHVFLKGECVVAVAPKDNLGPVSIPAYGYTIDPGNATRPFPVGYGVMHASGVPDDIINFKTVNAKLCR